MLVASSMIRTMFLPLSWLMRFMALKMSGYAIFFVPVILPSLERASASSSLMLPKERAFSYTMRNLFSSLIRYRMVEVFPVPESPNATRLEHTPAFRGSSMSFFTVSIWVSLNLRFCGTYEKSSGSGFLIINRKR